MKSMELVNQSRKTLCSVTRVPLSLARSLWKRAALGKALDPRNTLEHFVVASHASRL